MKEHYCTYSQAVKLKKLGFDWDVNKVYHRPSTLAEWELLPWYSEYKNWNNEGKFYRSAPTLSLAQKWLREEKGIIVWISPEFYEGDALEDVKWYFYTQPLQNLRKQRGGKVEGKYYKTYKLALSAGIDAALKLLTDKLNDK